MAGNLTQVYTLQRVYLQLHFGKVFKNIWELIWNGSSQPAQNTNQIGVKHNALNKTTDFITYWLDLSNWGRVTYKYVSELTIIGSDNGLSPGRHQVIIWTNAGISSIGTLGTPFSEDLNEIYTFSC